MVVLATNEPQLLDEALQDRIDEMVYFEKPSLTERANILYHYLIKYCKPERTWFEKVKLYISHPTILVHGKRSINISSLDSDYIDDIAKRTEGFSGRELTKLIVSWHDAAFAKCSPILDKTIIEEVLERQIDQNKTKDKWNLSQKEYFKLMHPKF
jgi:ATPase family AAA domain-containing protein 3A/B